MTPASRVVVDALVATGYVRVTRYARDPAEVAGALDHGDATVAVDIPRGYSRALLAGRPLPVQLLLDGANANTATIAQGYATQVIEAQGRGCSHARPGARMPSPSLGWKPGPGTTRRSRVESTSCRRSPRTSCSIPGSC